MANKKDEYWERRRAQMMYEQMEIAEKTAKTIGEEYYKTAKYIEAELRDNFDRVVNNLGINDKEIAKIVKASGSGVYQDIIRVAKNKGYTELVEYLEQPGRRARYERLIKQLEELNERITKLKGQEYDKITESLKTIAESTYYHSIYETQSQVGLGFSFAEWDEELFNKLASSTWSGANYSSRIWGNGDRMASVLKSELIQGFIAGKTYREMSDVIMKTFSAGAFEAKRLVRTEGCYIANEMNMQSYAECGIEKYRYVATLDLKTSAVCTSLDGQIFNVKDAAPGVNMPPMHPFCRSTTISVIDKEALQKMKRRARNPITGKNELVPADMTYKDWYKKYVEGNGKNRGLSANIGENDVPKHKSHKLVKEIDYSNGKKVKKELMNFEKNAIKEEIETACVITRNGKVYKCYGTKNQVFPDVDIGEELRGATVSHNHPRLETEYSFSSVDLQMFSDYELDVLRGCDDKYTYEFNRNADDIDEQMEEWFTKENYQHCRMIELAKKYGIGYRRWEND